MDLYDDRCVRLSALRKKCEDCQVRQVMRMNLYDDRCATFGITEKVRGLPGTASDAYAYELYDDDRCATFGHYGKKCEDCQLRQVMRMNLYDDRCATFGITEKVRGLPVTASDAYELVRRSCEDCQLRQVMRMRMNLYDDRCATFGITEKVREDCQLRQVMRMNLYDDRCATFGITEKVRGLPVTASDAYELVRRSCEDCQLRHVMRYETVRRSVCDFRHYALRKKCEDCQLRQVMRMNLYDDRCATFGITEKVRGLPVTASDAYELVRRSVCDFRHYGKKCEDCQLRQVMRMNLYDDRCATFGITEKVRGLPVTASDAYELDDDRCATFGITEKVRGLPVTASDAYELVRLSCEDCQLRQVMRMNSYDDRCATFGITEKVRGLQFTAGDAYELVRRSCATFGLTKKVRGLREMSSDAYELVRV
ncbi:unnamed protein product [Trichogramma brassicae]|uniref:Uncharacterized protein n=1 Tax=Trichogramma brassicae TaxID=86971 RepID=A0A6H5HV52_9HYME|nr:unnamed protein product [Trichogramma brassicae]